MTLEQTHRQLLERWRNATNLVGPGPIAEHFTDCHAALAAAETVLDTPVGTWADLGSGAGFPGLVFAQRYPRVTLDLVESRRRRCAFLEAVIGAGATDRPSPIRVRDHRIEDLATPYDGVMARALAPPPAALDLAAGATRPEGWAILLVGSDAKVDHPSFHQVLDTRYLPGRRVWVGRRR